MLSNLRPLSEDGHKAPRFTEGTFAILYEAVDSDDETGHSRQVAVKCLRTDAELARLRPASGARRDEILSYCRQAFERERRLWTRLGPHPGVVHALRADRVAERPALVLELVEGASMLELLDHPDAGPLPVLDVVDLLRQLAAALAHLHDHAHVVHGDVLPQNVLFDGFGRIMLADFGLAIDRRSPPPRPPFRLRFAPPEERKGQTGPEADIWRLGVTIAAALMGRELEPAEAQDPKLPERAVDFALDGAQGDARALSGPLLALLQQMLASDPRSRPSDGHALARWLRQASGSLKSTLERLTERDFLRRDVRWLGGRGAPCEELMRVAEELRRVEQLDSRIERSMPETHRCLAEAAWRSHLQQADSDLREAALTWARHAAHAYAPNRGLRRLMHDIVSGPTAEESVGPSLDRAAGDGVSSRSVGSEPPTDLVRGRSSGSSAPERQRRIHDPNRRPG